MPSSSRSRCPETVYPAKGLQIHQDIPDDVWEAYEELVKAGFDKHLIAATRRHEQPYADS